MNETDRPHENSYRVPATRLYAGEYPFRQDPEKGAAKLEQFLHAGIRCFIDLTMPADGMTAYHHLLADHAEREYRARHVSLGVPDMDVPPVAQMRRILDRIDEAEAAGENVYVHCWGGVGRTGTVVGCYLVRHGLKGEEALLTVQSLFATMSPGKVSKTPEGSPATDKQRQFVLDWAVIERHGGDTSPGGGAAAG